MNFLTSKLPLVSESFAFPLQLKCIVYKQPLISVLKAPVPNSEVLLYIE